MCVVVAPLELCWRDVADGRVSSMLVVEHLDVVEGQVLAATNRLEGFAELELERREPTLHRRVVVAVAGATHAANDAVLLEDPPVVLTGVRAASVRMME